MIARADRLRSGADFARVRSKGRSWSAKLVAAAVLPNGLGRNRYGFAAGKRLGGAVERNHAKRLLRESVRALQPRLAPGHDIVVIARNALVPETPYAVVHEQVESVLRRAHVLGSDDRPGEVA